MKNLMMVLPLICTFMIGATGLAKSESSMSSSAEDPTVGKTVDAIMGEENSDVLSLNCSTCEYSKSDNSISNCPSEMTLPERDHCKVLLWAQDTYRNPKYRRCGNFLIDTNGKLGSMGKVVLNEIIADVKRHAANETVSPFLQDNENLAEICPRFNDFDTVEKIQFYIFLMENLSYRELGCATKGPDNNAAPTTAAVCMFQMEGDPAVRKRLHRPAGCQGSESYIRSEQGCGKCAVDIMAWSLNAPVTPGHGYTLPNKPFGTLNDDGGIRHSSYWFALNPDIDSFLEKWQEHNGNHKTPHQGLVGDIKWFPLCSEGLPRR